MHVIGTAGHVDHGKSTLVRALTGIDPDRLIEEKEREMTIDLGFAWLTLGSEEVGVVDVPGHRDFIENMLAGIGGIDLALFVVAADEGIMPQTREHLAILDLLGVTEGVVALTKTDQIDDTDWLELVTIEVAGALQGTSLENSPIVPVSARSGVGIPDLKSALTIKLGTTAGRPDLGRPLLPIDRVFSLPGHGTIVTGTLVGGSLAVGDEVDIHPGDMTGRIRTLQTHKLKREQALPGSRVAINLTGIDRKQLHRGMVVAGRGVTQGTYLLDARYRHLPDADAPLKHNAEVKVFVGSAEVSARTRVIGKRIISAGEEGWLQLALASPVATVRGDRFILRRPSPGATLGGGIILDAHPARRHRRFNERTLTRFQTLNDGSPEAIILNVLASHGHLPRAAVAEQAGLPEQTMQSALDTLIRDGQVLWHRDHLTVRDHWQDLQERLLRILTQFHESFPMRSGMDKEELRNRLGISGLLLASLCEDLESRSQLVEEGTTIRLQTHQLQFSPQQNEAISTLETLLSQRGVLAPSVKECMAIVGEDVYHALVQQGRVKPVSRDAVYSVEIYDKILSRMIDFIVRNGSITPAETRDLLGTSRKYSIALLEHLDELHVTRRLGDTRVLTHRTPA
jgi:selenocysteine-specific elongation factor